MTKNINKPVQYVKHSELERFDDDSDYKSDCPSCTIGILCMQRGENGILLNTDRCAGCGQSFVYIDVVEGQFGIKYK